MLESYGAGAGDPAGYTHYMKGGKPGYYPPIAGRAGFGQVTLNLWDPFNLVQNNSAEKTARGSPRSVSSRLAGPCWRRSSRSP